MLICSCMDQHQYGPHPLRLVTCTWQGCRAVSSNTWIVEEVKARHWAMQLSRTGPSGRRLTRTPLQALEEELRSLPADSRWMLAPSASGHPGPSLAMHPHQSCPVQINSGAEGMHLLCSRSLRMGKAPGGLLTCGPMQGPQHCTVLVS